MGGQVGEKHICRILVFKIVSQYNALSVFEEELIQNWKNNFPDTYKAFQQKIDGK